MPTLPPAPAPQPGLTPRSRVESPRDPGHLTQAGKPAPSPADTIHQTGPQNAWQRIKERVSVHQAAAVLKKAGKLPLMLDGSAQARVKDLLKSVPVADRAGLAGALAYLMPPYAHAEVYDAAAAWLLRLPPDARAPFAAVVGELSGTLRLIKPEYTHEFIELLDTLHALPEDRRRSVMDACREMQPTWQRDIPAKVWSRALRTVGHLPEGELIRLSFAVWRHFPCRQKTQRHLEAFLECLEIFVAHDEVGRDGLKQQLSQTGIADYGSFRAATLSSIEIQRLFLKASPEIQSAIAHDSNAIIPNATDMQELRIERTCVAVALLRADAQKRSAVRDLLAALDGVSVRISAEVVEDLDRPWAQPLYQDAAREELFALVDHAFESVGLNADDAWPVLRSLLQVPVPERAEAAELARLLVERRVAIGPDAEALLRASPEQRRRRGYMALLRGHDGMQSPAQRIGGAADMENVMQGALQARTDEAIEALSKRFPNPMATPLALQEVSACLEGLAAQAGPEDILRRSRGGDTEVNNAIRTLSGPIREGDFSESVTLHPGMSKLVALVWHAIGAPRAGVEASQVARDQALMRHGLVMALARCIEDDGHRVCGVGQRQYVVDVLKGYYEEAGDVHQSVTPRSLVTVLTADFYESHGEETPAPEQVESFKKRAREVASARFGETTAEMAEFVAQFDSYMQMTY